MKKKALEAEWISYSNFKETHEQHIYNLRDMKEVLGEGRFNVENGQSCVSNKRYKYDIDFTMNKDAYLYKGPKEDIDEVKITNIIGNSIYRFSSIKELIELETINNVANGDSFESPFIKQSNNLLNSNALKESYLKKINVRLENIKNLSLKLSELEEIDKTLRSKWIEKE
ncbi:MAG: hypothetical protein KH761_04540 [Veillonella sp.]|uniref:hypothetical protein n=1 Tax=Veillonella sp. TaxID=1926307 RepID=UPI00257A2423|nr:hypothetical protein [Veillonella sp.]MBS6126088.1 hypothetical protein [Veillonella sp.]